ncbi:putative transporter [Pseudocercospora fuligena]|uniref:Putative transporter n=1 Tax=Pseudocercospora fuligena TaxID=685502 RepID=A0A8H6RFR2_9PEZI|nr:putative transporter [Pseudocercospora fuligena]
MATSMKTHQIISKVKSKFVGKDASLRPFRLLRQDVAKFFQRWPSDWTIFNSVVLASSVFIFFTNLLPGITFASELYALTGQNWGTVEIILSTGLCNITFSLFGLQPLTVLGVTGSFTVIAEHLYNLVTESFGVPFLPFMAWSLIHTCWMLWLLATFNAHEWTSKSNMDYLTVIYLTDFTCQIFSLLNSIIYFNKALQEFRRGHREMPFEAFLYSVIDGVGTFLLALLLSSAEKWKVFPRWLRTVLRQYATAIAVIFFVAIGYAGEAAQLDKARLSTSSDRFAPSNPERSTFFVEFWTLSPDRIAVAMLPGMIITMLFFFDHEISTIICTSRRFGIRKPSGLTMEMFLLGITTALCGILGIPPANGLLPQAPLHSESLLHIEVEEIDGLEHPMPRVYEQRWSKLIHGGAIMACIAPPLQLVLGFTPTSVLAGLFMFMGQQSLCSNPIFERTLNMFTPISQLPALPSGIPSYWPLHGYTICQIVITVVVFIVTLTIAGPAFPVIIIALVPLRLLLMPKMWSREVLRYLDKWSCKDGTPEDGDEEKIDDCVIEYTPTRPLIPSLVLGAV